MSSHRIIQLFKERNNTIKNLLAAIFPDNSILINIHNEQLSLTFKDSSMFKAAMATFKDHVDVNNMANNNNRVGYCLQLSINENLVSALKSTIQLNSFRKEFQKGYLEIEKQNIHKTIDLYRNSYPDLNNQYKEILNVISSEAEHANDIKQISLVSQQLNSLKEEIKDHYKSIENTKISSSSQNEDSQLEQYSRMSSVSEEEMEHKYDDIIEPEKIDLVLSKNEAEDFDTEIDKLMEKLNNPEKRKEYIKECQVLAKEQGHTGVRFIEYTYGDKTIGRVSEQDKERLDELLANKLQQEENQQRPKMK